jgi:hypothetical protein
MKDGLNLFKISIFLLSRRFLLLITAHDALHGLVVVPLHLHVGG